MSLPNDPITTIVDGDAVNGAIASAPHAQLLVNDRAMDAILSAATSAASVSTLMKRDAAGRAKVVAPAASTDIALLSTVESATASHVPVKQTAHGVYHGRVDIYGDSIHLPPGWTSSKITAGMIRVNHTMSNNNYSVIPAVQLGSNVNPVSKLYAKTSTYFDIFTVLADQTGLDSIVHFAVFLD